MKYLKIPFVEGDKGELMCAFLKYEDSLYYQNGEGRGGLLEADPKTVEELLRFLIDEQDETMPEEEPTLVIDANTTLGELTSELLKDVEAPPTDDEPGYTVEELQQALDIVEERRKEGKEQEPFLPINSAPPGEEEGS